MVYFYVSLFVLGTGCIILYLRELLLCNIKGSCENTQLQFCLFGLGQGKK